MKNLWWITFSEFFFFHSIKFLGIEISFTANYVHYPLSFNLKLQWRPTRKMFVYKIQVNPIHTILKYGDYYDFMDR